MTNITNIQDNTNDFAVVATQIIKDKLSEIADNLYTTSKKSMTTRQSLSTMPRI